MTQSEPTNSVTSRPLIVIALLALAIQIGVGASRDFSAFRNNADLPPVPSPASMHVVALGEPIWLSRVLSVWLQFFDHRSGAGLAWNTLDYQVLAGWLDLQLQLDPHNPFPPLAAVHLYGGVSDPARVRAMVDYIVALFRRDPGRHWRWMADAAILAKHRLDDLDLAERIASELDQRTRGVPIPSWARQMHIFLKADLGESELAAAILTALIENGDITNEAELNFLRQRLNDLNRGVDKSSKN